MQVYKLWHQNEFESGGWHTSGMKCWEKFVVPFFFLALQVQVIRFGERFCDGPYIFGQFLVCCSSTHGAPVPSHL